MPSRRRVPSFAYAVAAAGAILGWDECGCGGDCGYRWFDEKAVARVVAAGPPTIRRGKHERGAISVLRSDDGGSLLVVRAPVVWGDALG